MLLAREVGHAQSDEEMFVARLTIELLRPVPRTPLAARHRFLRPGRKVQLVEASLWDGDTEVARVTALSIRRSSAALPEDTHPRPHDPPDAVAEWMAPYRSSPAYHLTGVEIRAPETEGAPNWAWVRLKVPLLAGEEPSGLIRICAAADFPNGISNVVGPDRFSYINPDVTVYLYRLPRGEWVLVDARTWLQPHGTGMAEGALYDEFGRIGRSMQALLVEPRSEE